MCYNMGIVINYMSEINCKNLYEDLGRLKELKVEFDRAYEAGVMKRDFSECEKLYKEIKELMGDDSEIGKVLIMRRLKIKEQYETQVDVAWKSGLFEKKEGAESDLPVIERYGNKYQMPSWSDVQSTLRKPENLKFIKEKSAQGFTKMLVVPFAYDLTNMVEKLAEKVKELDEAGLNADGTSNPNKGIFGAGGEKVEFNRADGDYPVFIWSDLEDSALVYYPKRYVKDDHGGITKEDVIQVNGAWQICFVEDLPVIPEDGKVIGGRKQIDRSGRCIYGSTPTINDYREALNNHTDKKDKKQMKNPSKYEGERGQMGEVYIWMQITSILGNDVPILMDYENGAFRGSSLLDCYNASEDVVPSGSWDEADQILIIGRLKPDMLIDDGLGIRTTVNIK